MFGPSAETLAALLLPASSFRLPARFKIATLRVDRVYVLHPFIQRSLTELGLDPEAPPAQETWRRFLAAQSVLRTQDQRMSSLGRLTAEVFHELNGPLQFVGHNTSFLGEAVGPLLRALYAFREMLERSADAKAPPASGEVAALSRHFNLDFLASEIPAAAEQSLDGIARMGALVKAMTTLSRHQDEEPCEQDLNTALSAALVVVEPQLARVADLRVELGDVPPVVCVLCDVAHALVDVLEGAAGALAAAREPLRAFIGLRSAVDGVGVQVSVSIRPAIELPAMLLARGVVEEHLGTFQVEHTKEFTAVTMRLPLAGPESGGRCE